MATTDQLFDEPTSGQNNWDASLNGNFTILERGFHVTARAGANIRTGDVVWMNSGGFAFQYNPQSTSIRPHGFAYTGASSGDTFNFLRRGIVRSLSVLSNAVPGKELFTSTATPGAIVSSYAGANPVVGIGLHGDGSVGGILFDPQQNYLSEKFSRAFSIAAVTGSLHVFSVDLGRYGWMRELRVVGNSANFAEVKFYSNSTKAASSQLFATKSGGVYTVSDITSAYWDRAGFPYENTDPSTLGALIYGTLMVLSTAAVGSDTITIFTTVDREQ